MPQANLFISPPRWTITRIISGGQTGADRAGLDFAIQHGIEVGGWCPRGRRSESGPIPDIYPLKETPGDSYTRRTTLNVRDSDATLVFHLDPISGGTKETRYHCIRLNKPFVLLNTNQSVDRLIQFFADHPGLKIVNVAGPRASKCPAIYHHVIQTLTLCYQILIQNNPKT